jgi:hypothetical protein
MIDPGRGYRLLTPEDVRTKGDEYCIENNIWRPIWGELGQCYGSRIGYYQYRRKLKPEEILVDYLWSTSYTTTGMP